MKDFWNQRYREEAYAYGTEPNTWLRQQLPQLKPGRLLLPAEGEGRNAAYAASLGWEVLAIDYSEAGRDKALALAAERGVNITYELAAVHEYPYPEAAFEAAALIYAHLPPELRRETHRLVAQALKPGGTLILEAFGKSQLELSSGGPKALEVLYSPEELREDFPSLDWDILEETEVELEEGPYHKGAARVVRALGRRMARS